MRAALATTGLVGDLLLSGGSARRERPRSVAVQRRAWHGARPTFEAVFPVARNEDAAASELVEVRAIAAGDSAAFRRLIERESPRLLRFALAMLGSLEEAEDVVQETLLSLWENAAAWTPEARIGTWLYRVCHNRSIDRLRRRRTFVDDGALDELADSSEPADLGLIHGEEARDLRDAVARLAPRQRTAVLLFHFEELPQREAAEVMGISEAALESLLARARRQMRRWLGVDGDGND
ncbi:MAG: RNA polymerase sigma factor [Propylenella sp.]